MKRNKKREGNLKTRNTLLGFIARNDPTRFKDRVVLSEDEKLVSTRARRKATWRREEKCETT